MSMIDVSSERTGLIKGVLVSVSNGTKEVNTGYCPVDSPRRIALLSLTCIDTSVNQALQ